VVRIYFPPDANSLLSVAEHCFESRNYVNLIVIDKQPQLQYLDLPAACKHAAAGASIWDWASNEQGGEVDVVLGCVGDIPTMETLAAAAMLREHTPDLSVRVVNVIDLMVLFPREVHPHGLSESDFLHLFGAETEVVMAFHGYARALHQVLHGHPNPGRFHVRGFNEQGTTTTPFDMVVLNKMSRFHLAAEALRRTPRRPDGAEELLELCDQKLSNHETYVRDHLEDLPEISDWTWSVT
jgi:xylulose-5-phosphate/fructose-6-phosphate phosphoketolase